MENNFLTVAVLTSVVLIVGYLYRKKFFPKNKAVFDFVNDTKEFDRFDNVWLAVSKAPVFSSEYVKVFVSKKFLVITDEYSLNLNPNAKKYSDTAIVVDNSTRYKTGVNLKNFKKVFVLNQPIYVDGKNIVLDVKLFTQVMFSKKPFDLPSTNVILKIKADKKIMESLQSNSLFGE